VNAPAVNDTYAVIDDSGEVLGIYPDLLSAQEELATLEDDEFILPWSIAERVLAHDGDCGWWCGTWTAFDFDTARLVAILDDPEALQEFDA
jgi:hypothetical protein